jgi:RND family efflux transporter MFP subunit
MQPAAMPAGKHRRHRHREQEPAGMSDRFSEKWLETLCDLLPDAHSAVFMVPNPDTDGMHLLARWPSGLDQYRDFFDSVKHALQRRGEACLSRAAVVDGEPLDYFVEPVYVRSRLAGVLSVKMKHQPESKHGDVFQSLKRGVSWLGLANANKTESDEFYGSVVGVLASCFEQQGYQQGLMRMVAELTAEFNCERVAFGEMRGHHCQVIALSNSADFDQRSNLVRRIADAMDEAVEQDRAILFPDPDSRLIQRAHRKLLRKHDLDSIATIPLVSTGKVFGAITLVGSEVSPIDRKTLDLCQQILSLLTPYLVLQRDRERGLLLHIAAGLGNGLRALFGIRFLKTKLLMLTAASLIAVASLVEADFRITADAVLEGEVQRVVAAPISGYLLSSSVRAGDTIRRGEIMASLNDAELRLELARLNGGLEKLRREYREAQSTRDLVGVRVIREQINQNTAEIDLVQRQLDSIHMRAPFDGVVIEGDLSQALGSPVERGETLFKIAPLDDYRIILKVDERDIAYLEPGQEGSLTLSSLSQQRMPIRVERITSVAKAEDGANFFRVEASLPNSTGVLRPGMEGIGKINAGRERILWIWSREFVDWLRLWVWSWWP